jgi:hypothetical protein
MTEEPDLSAFQPDPDSRAKAAATEPDERDARYLRLAADFENFKRRKTQEIADVRRYESEDAALALLPVLDNLRRAVEHAGEAGAEEFFVSGLQLVVREFETALERIGVVPVPAVGERDGDRGARARIPAARPPAPPSDRPRGATARHSSRELSEWRLSNAITTRCSASLATARPSS